MILLKSELSSIDLTVEKLKKGEIVIIPTDTVYGFSGIVDSNYKTDLKIREIKGRDENKPFIQLISSVEEIFKYTKDKIPDCLLEKWCTAGMGPSPPSSHAGSRPSVSVGSW